MTVDASPQPPNEGTNASSTTTTKPLPKRAPRIIRRKKKSTSTSSSTTTTDSNSIPPHIQNNTQLHHIISTTLPNDYEFEIPKTIWRIEKANATSIALQLPEGLTMYASTIGDILIKFAYRFMPPSTSTSSHDKNDATTDNNNNSSSSSSSRPTEIKSLSIMGDVTYGACCIDDLSARALGCDLLVHYGHSCLVPLTCTVIPCLYVFVEIRVDVQHCVDCVRLTFAGEEEDRRRGDEKEVDGADVDGCTNTHPSRIIEALVMGTVQFRSAVIESAQRLDGTSTADASSPSASGTALSLSSSQVQFQAIVPQAKPLSPGEVLGCTAPGGLATMDFQEALQKTRRRNARRNQDPATSVPSSDESTTVDEEHIPRERVMIFLADGRFHLEAAMISNPSIRALRYDPYSKTLTEERYEIVKMKKLRREAIMSVRQIMGIASPSQRLHVIRGTKIDSSSDDIANSVLNQQSAHAPTSTQATSFESSSGPITMGIILGTLGRQGNPAILSRIRTLLHSRGIRTIIVLLSEIFPKKLEMMSNTSGGGVSAWVQIACPRLSIDWGHYFCVPVLSPFELFVALGEVVDTSLWSAADEGEEKEEKTNDVDGYPMDFYSKAGGPWANYYDSNTKRKAMSYGS